MDYLKLFQTHQEYETFVSGGTMVRPNVSHCVSENEVHYNPYVHDYSQDYFTIESLEDGVISFNIPRYIGTNYATSFSYSTDNGNTWETIENSDDKSEDLVTIINVRQGDKLLWKGIAKQLCDEFPSCAFSSSCRFNVYGNIMSLLYGDEFSEQTVIPSDSNYAFSNIFHDYNGDKTCYLVDASNLTLPATTLAQGCYSNMFQGCTSLTTAPALPATTLVSGCYSNMFQGCTSLTTAPELPATTLPGYCYSSMFNGCTSLTTAP